MRLSRRPPPEPLPLLLPRPDGTGWPDAPGLGRAGFDVQTYGQIGERRAADPDALGVAERLLEVLLPVLALEAPAEDAPHVHKTHTVAARRGAGLGLVERELPSAQDGVVDRRFAGALWLARADLPRRPADVAAAAAYLLLAGYWAARTDTAPHLRAAQALAAAAR